MRRFLPLALAALFGVGASALAQTLAEAPVAPPARQPVSEERVDAAGVEWFYEERADEIDDRWQVLVMGTVVAPGPSQGAAIGLLCVEGLGGRIQLDVPGWAFGDGVTRTLQARIDRAEAFEVAAVGLPMDRAMAYLEWPRGGQRLMEGLAAARERIVVRNPDRGTVVFPMGAERPEVDRAIRLCREMTRRR